MATIEVSEIETGMILADDLRDQNGRFLLGKGEKIAPKHIKIMKTWGIVDADIEGVSKQDIDSKRKEKIDPAIRKAAEENVRKRFCHNDLKHEVIRQLYDICVLRKAEELAENGKPVKTQGESLSSSNEDSPVPKGKASPNHDPKQLIKNGISLPSLPVIFHQINEAISDPRCSATHIASIISKDSSLSARLLTMVNSAFYNFPSEIDTISRAVAIVGTKQLSTLSLSASALTAFKDVSPDLIDMKSFWKHSIACGTLARLISSYKQNALTERYFVAGLLHDIGRLVIFQSLSSLASEALVSAGQTNRLLRDTEIERLGFDHAKIGGMMLKKWKFPAILEKAVRYHHNHKDPHIQLDTSVVNLADIIANALKIGSSGERFVPTLNPDAWNEIGISTSILSAVIQQAEHHIEETVQIFFHYEH